MGGEGGRKAKGHGLIFFALVDIFARLERASREVTWERGEEEIEGWLGLMLDPKGEEDGWALTHGES
jgi:hypothetical protein